MTHIGIGNFGDGSIVFQGPAVGQQYSPAPAGTGTPPGGAADVGVLTVLPEEMGAVVHLLQYCPGYAANRLTPRGPLAYEARVGRARVVAMQTLDRGPRSAVVAYQNLVRDYAPPVVLLVGIAGGISERVRIGDVVLGDAVVYYDARRETADGPQRRGETQPIAAALGHRLNDFLTATHGAAFDASGAEFRILRGPIGSGDAVITDVNSEIRHWLLSFHEKLLAVETEAAGVAQAFYEEVGAAGAPRGWLTVRGISDRADAAKGHDHHRLAALRAATAMLLLVPYLV